MPKVRKPYLGSMLRKGLVAAAMSFLLVVVLAACSNDSADSGSTTKPNTAPPTPAPEGKAPAASQGSGPRITVDKESQDFGKVRLEQWVRPVFRISNTGDADLSVSRVTVDTLEGC